MLKQSPRLKIISCVTNDSAEETLVQPKANSTLIFQHFLSNVAVKIDGVESKVYPGDCLIQSSSHPDEYQGEDLSWSSDRCAFDGEDMKKFIHELGLPINQIFRPTSTHFVTPLLEKISLEKKRQSVHCEIIISFGLQELLVKLSRHWLEARNQRFGVISPDPQEKMEEIRSIVHDQLSTQWSVPEMAKLGNLSASRFAFLYKKIFDVTPMEDLIRKRIRQASILLSDTSKSIAEIAEESGFEDLQYFYRSFKKRLGTTPKRLRTRNSSASPWKSYDEQRGNLEAVWASSDFHGMIGSNEEGTPFIQAVSGDWSQLGWNRHELTSQPLLDLIHPDDDCLVKKASQSVLSGGLLHNLELRTLCKNGHFLKIEWTGASSGDAFYFSANIAKLI